MIDTHRQSLGARGIRLAIGKSSSWRKLLRIGKTKRGEMNHLHQLIAAQSRKWREADYPCERFPAIAEILEYQPEGASS